MGRKGRKDDRENKKKVYFCIKFSYDVCFMYSHSFSITLVALTFGRKLMVLTGQIGFQVMGQVVMQIFSN